MEEKKDEIKNDKNEINNNNEIKDKNENIKNVKINDENVNEENKLNNVHFTEILNYDGKKKLEIYHLIIANEDSDAGKIYNQYAYNFIESVYNLISERKNFDIFEQVKDNFKNLASTIINNKIKDIPFTSNENILEDKIIKLELKESLSLKKCYTDDLGFSLFKTDNFEPKYNYFKPDENTLEIRLEVPGKMNCEVMHKNMGDETIVTIKGTKIKDKQPAKPEDDLYNIREFSDFELNIPLKVEEFKISQPKPKDGYPKFSNGVCLIQFELALKGENVEAKVDADDL